jgi:LmeA-like phospholipid-binding
MPGRRLRDGYILRALGCGGRAAAGRWIPDAFRRSRPHSWSVIIVAALAAFFAALLIADRVTLIYAEERVARQIGNRGFPAKPQVSIAGFPFLTQVAARRLNKVVVSAAGKKLGPVEVKRLDVTLYGIRVGSSCHVRTASQLSGTALIGFPGLAGVGGLPGLTVAADGPDQVKITIGAGLRSKTATARVTPVGPGVIRLVVISAGGIPLAALGSLRDISLPLAALPRGTTIHGVSVTGQGVLVHLAGQDVSFGG